jgi:hypothetical protein
MYPWKRMHRSRAPSIAPGTFFVAQSWADSITDMPGVNLRQAQGPFLFVAPRSSSRAARHASFLSARVTRPAIRTPLYGPPVGM